MTLDPPGAVRPDPDRPPPRTLTLLAPGGSSGPLLSGLADRLVLAGHEVVHAPDPLPPDLPVVAVVEHGDQLDRLATLGPHDGVVASEPEVVDRLRAGGLRAHRLPVMTPIARQRALRAASQAPLSSSGGAIGWTVLGRRSPDDRDARAVIGAAADGLHALLEARPELGVEIVGDPAVVPDRLTGHPQVRLVVGPTRSRRAGRWTAHLVTPGVDGPLLEVALLEAAHAGVPTLLPAASARAVGGLADPLLVVDEPTAPPSWIRPLQLLLDGDDRPSRSAWALATSEALEQQDATDLVIARLLGWLDREPAR